MQHTRVLAACVGAAVYAMWKLGAVHPARSAHLLHGRPRTTGGFVQQSRHILVLLRMLLLCFYLLCQQLLLPLLLFLPGSGSTA